MPGGSVVAPHRELPDPGEVDNQTLGDHGRHMVVVDAVGSRPGVPDKSINGVSRLVTSQRAGRRRATADTLKRSTGWAHVCRELDPNPDIGDVWGLSDRGAADNGTPSGVSAGSWGGRRWSAPMFA